MTDSRSHVIELNAIEFSWKAGIPVLDIPELTVFRGEKAFVRGPSGSGKTTLLGLLGGVITAERGQVKVLENDISRFSPVQRDLFRADHIGFIFQMFNLIPYLSVIENVTLPLSFAKQRKSNLASMADSEQDEARRLLRHLELDDSLLHRPVTELSIGQQQRVAAARALIGKPDLIIADEPTSALDTDTREAFINLLFAECEAAGNTLLFVSHDQSLESLFDRSIVLNEINRASQPPSPASPTSKAIEVD